MAYILQADLLAQVSENQLIQLTDDNKLGQVITDTVTRAISDAEAEINGYLAARSRYTVPVAVPIPALIKKLAIDIAIWNLYRRRQRVPEDVRHGYEDARRMLESIAKGLISVGSDPPPPASSTANSGEVFGPDRLYTRDTLGSF